MDRGVGANPIMPGWYPDLLASVADRVERGQRQAIGAVNRELVLTYWAIGRDILDRQDEEGWGTKVIDRLSTDLRRQFTDARGYSPRNLKYMRAFAAAWPDIEIVQRSVAQLPWRHQIALIEKLTDPDSRLWYAAAAIEDGWSRDILVHHVDGRLRERSGKAITNFTATLAPADSDQAQQATRDPYLFDFIGNAPIRRERDLEIGLVEHVEKFLLELGQGFAYVGRQVRLDIGEREFYADLLFYHLRLRAYVVIELKAVEFEPEFLGQIGMYMAAIDDLLAHPDDKPTIGLLVCRSKDNVVAEYALRGYNVPIGVAEWKTELVATLPADLAQSLPSIEELEAELSDPKEDTP
ncbi:MAG TPA: PDDEXK nuclease domain-containing protein [Actinopolymorphaceae bacterium]|jgi:predicted nuclease of restriction endonuclease-like (RecB) superfamily